MARYRRARLAPWWHGLKRKRGRVVVERIPRDSGGDPGPAPDVGPKEPA